MITTVSDFLEQFRKYSLSKIEKEEKGISHTPTIGNIYEGLTANILDQGIFDGLNLKIVEKSFIYNDSELMSLEFDCLLVVGDGQRISFTNQYKYHIKDVIAVFQVKKNLYTNDLVDSYENLQSVIKISEPRDADAFVGRLHHDAYKLLTSKEFPSKERRERFTDRESIVYHFLMMEAFYPLRIVIGYYGYKDEYGLREGFCKNLEKISKDGLVKGYSPGRFPNLIICGTNSIIKNNGMPIGIPFTSEEFYWPILVSSNERAMYYLLELVWTRLSYKFKLDSQIFGDDFQLDATHPFLFCKETKIEADRWAWEYNYKVLTRERLSIPLTPREWEPVEINELQSSILLTLCKQEYIDIYNDESFIKFIEGKNLSIDKLIEDLEATKLVYVDDGKMGLLTEELLITFTPDGKSLAGENRNGEMTNYLMRQKK